MKWNSNIVIKFSLFIKVEWVNLGIVDRNYCIIEVIDMENGWGIKVF